MSVPVQWVVGLMVALEPQAPWRATFEKSAEAIARVAESEPLFDDHGEERTAAMLVAIAWYESRLKPSAKSSNGQWYCLFQIDKRHLPDPQKALVDPEICARAAVKIIKASLAKCSARPAEERLAAFMSGTCERGVADSRYRMFLANKLLKEHPFPSATGGGTARAR
ncbi:MAG: transglycosylase SLT domain-containing protein [Labilithrix sp.]|nr:transglycosylase SLT domain-containing protein [Labilithrix sp.]